MRMETLGAFSTFLAAVVAVEQQGSNAAALGLLLTYALQVWAQAVHAFAKGRRPQLSLLIPPHALT